MLAGNLGALYSDWDGEDDSEKTQQETAFSLPPSRGTLAPASC